VVDCSTPAPDLQPYREVEARFLPAQDLDAITVTTNGDLALDGLWVVKSLIGMLPH